MKTFFGSFLGALLGIVVVGLIFVLIIVGAVRSSINSKKSAADIQPKTILHLKLDMPISEREPKNPFADFSSGLDMGNTIGLNLLLDQIQKAKGDSNIKGIYLEAPTIGAGMATVEELRNALLDFRKSGKFIVSYGEVYSQKGYYLATVANEIYMHPQGDLSFKGVSAQVMFFKKMLDKLDVDVQVFKHGKYKSAVEPFDLEQMSASNRIQTASYVNDLWEKMVAGIAEQRKLDRTTLNGYADNLSVRHASDAKNLRLIDDTKYEDEVIDILSKKLGLGAGVAPKYVTPQKYHHAMVEKSDGEKITTDKIAVVYAVGAIQSGQGDDETIGSERIVTAIRSAREDKNVKALVLRVNSPGGSSLASDVIWREVVLTKKVKPVVVSMGDVAASGGYYIACAADKIIAQPNTITGSIGVFGLLPNLKTVFEERIGITFDTVNSNRHADFGAAYRPVTEMEGQVIQQSVENVYQSFIQKVADGRGMTIADVDSIGQGRVWSGTSALRIGLVDKLGGLNDAIALAAELAKIGKSYRIQSLPKQKSPFEEFFKKAGVDARTKLLEQELGTLNLQYQQFKRSQQLLQLKGVQARIPYDIIVE
jgi:protease-4